MPIYTLYPRHPDGSGGTFISLELADDTGAHAAALKALDDHASATRVEVWCGERQVQMRRRAHPELALVLRR